MTDSPPKPQDGSASRAVFWVLAARQGERLLGIISIAILARLLSPADFGLVAMATSVVAVVEVISTFGFDWAVVRLAEPTRAHYDSAWTLRLLCGVLVAVLLAAAAYPAAMLFTHPEVAWIIVAMGASSLLGSMENIWMAEFRRHSQFEPEFKLRMGAKVVGFIAGVGWAVMTHSYWALVVGALSSRVTATFLSYRLHASRPRWDLSMRGDLLNFSVWLLLGNLAETIRTRFADMWLGRNIGSRGVGFYSMASELSTLATSELAAPINRAVFAKYAQRSGDVPALRQGYLRVSGLLWLIGVPAAVGTGVCAEPIVRVLLGDQWDQAALVLQILAAAGLLGVITANTQYVYWALGRSRFVTSLSVIGSIGFIFFTLILGQRYGLLGVAWAQVVASGIVAVVNLTALFRTLGMTLGDFIARNWRVVAASAAMGAVVMFVGGWFEERLSGFEWVRLTAMVGAGAASYFTVLYLLWIAGSRPEGAESEAFSVLTRYGQRAKKVVFGGG